MAAKKKKSTGRKVVKPVLARRIDKPVTIEDFFNDDSGELRNAQHEMFAQAWVQTFNNEGACRVAGIAFEDSRAASIKARDILRREEIQIRVRTILKERVKNYAITEDWVVLKIMDLLELAATQKEFRNKEGEVIGSETDVRAALKAAELLGQNLGMFQKVDKKVAQNITFNLNYGSQPEQPALTRQPIPGVSTRLN